MMLAPRSAGASRATTTKAGEMECRATLVTLYASLKVMSLKVIYASKLHILYNPKRCKLQRRRCKLHVNYMEFTTGAL